MSETLLTAILRLIDEYESGELDLPGLQSALEANASALDNSYAGVVRALRQVDADLETIRFARPLAQQPAAARATLADLQALVHQALAAS